MTETAPTPTQGGQTEPTGSLEEFVGRQAGRLWHGYQADRPDAVSELARLRRALPRSRFLPPEAWEVFERGYPEHLRGRGDAPSRDELAAATSLSLFAIHQQSKRNAPMHIRGADHTLGKAAHRLRMRVDSQGVERRVQALTRSNDLEPLVEHLRALITQLRAESIALDYARLAVDLARVQWPEGLRGVRTRWLRDFYRPRPQTADDTITPKENA